MSSGPGPSSGASCEKSAPTVSGQRGVCAARALPIRRDLVSQRDPDQFLERFSDLSRCLRALKGRTYATVEVGSTQAKFLRHIGRNSHISQADLARATTTDPTLT